jgi:hypothetical protein
MNKVSFKRKNDQEELREMVNPCKRLKISEIVRENIVKEENNHTQISVCKSILLIYLCVLH